MANYAKMARDAADRRKTLETELDGARKTVKDCEKELAVLSQIIGALKGVAPAAGRRGPRPGPKPGRKAGRKAGKRRKGGKWKKGHPGRPPKWYVEQQKAAGGAKKTRKRRGRKPGRKSAPKPVLAPSDAPLPQG